MTQFTLSQWSFALGIPLALVGVFALVVTSICAKTVKALPRWNWLGWSLSTIAWIWAAYAVKQMGLDFLEPYKVYLPYITVVCIPLTWIVLNNLLTCRAWGGILCLFPCELLHAARINDSPWRLVLVTFAYVCIVWGMTLLLYPWKMRQLNSFLADHPWALRTWGVASLLLGVFFCALGKVAFA